MITSWPPVTAGRMVCFFKIAHPVALGKELLPGIFVKNAISSQWFLKMGKCNDSAFGRSSSFIFPFLALYLSLCT